MSKIEKVVLIPHSNRPDTHKKSAIRVRQAIIDDLTDTNTTQPAHTISLASIVNNTLISLAGQVVTWLSTLTLMISYGRFLGDAKFGELFLALTFVMLMGTPIDSGYDNQITRGVAEEPDKVVSYLSNILVIK